MVCRLPSAEHLLAAVHRRGEAELGGGGQDFPQAWETKQPGAIEPAVPCRGKARIDFIASVMSYHALGNCPVWSAAAYCRIWTQTQANITESDQFLRENKSRFVFCHVHFICSNLHVDVTINSTPNASGLVQRLQGSRPMTSILVQAALGRRHFARVASAIQGNHHRHGLCLRECECGRTSYSLAQPGVLA